MEHQSRTDLPAKWTVYRKGEPLPDGINFIDTKEDGWPIGIGRAKHHDDVLPGILHIKNMELIVAYGSKSHCYDDGIEVLCYGNLEWKPSKDGISVENAFPGGFACYGEELYIGKTNLEGNVYIGKVHPSHRCLYIPYRSAELKVEEYSQLVDHNQLHIP